MLSKTFSICGFPCMAGFVVQIVKKSLQEGDILCAVGTDLVHALYILHGTQGLTLPLTEVTIHQSIQAPIQGDNAWEICSANHLINKLGPTSHGDGLMAKWIKSTDKYCPVICTQLSKYLHQLMSTINIVGPSAYFEGCKHEWTKSLSVSGLDFRRVRISSS